MSDLNADEKKKQPQQCFAMLSVGQIVEPSVPLRINLDVGPKFVESVKNGIIEPIVVRPKAKGLFECIVGNRRLDGAKKAGLEEVPSIIVDVTDKEAHFMTLRENKDRTNENAIERAAFILKMMQVDDLSQSEIAESLCVSEASVSNLLRVYADEYLRSLVERNLLPLQGAIELLSIRPEEDDPDFQRAMGEWRTFVDKTRGKKLKQIRREIASSSAKAGAVGGKGSATAYSKGGAPGSSSPEVGQKPHEMMSVDAGASSVPTTSPTQRELSLALSGRVKALEDKLAALEKSTWRYLRDRALFLLGHEGTGGFGTVLSELPRRNETGSRPLLLLLAMRGVWLQIRAIELRTLSSSSHIPHQ